MENSIISTTEKYDYTVMQKDIAALKNKYPFIKVSSIGKSAEGRSLSLIKIGNGYKKTLFIGAHHGREYVSSVYLMREAEMLSYFFQNNTVYQGIDFERFFEKNTLYFLPMLNPDGVNISIFGKNAAQCPQRIENMRLISPKYAAWKANANGVDLNRQYPCLWEQKHSNVLSPASESFKGYSPASEPEVKALMRLCKTEDFHASASFHSKGEEIYWADRNSVSFIFGAKEAALRISKLCGYTVMPVSMDPAKYSAGFENWFRGEFHKISFLFELAPYKNGYMPFDMKNFEKEVWQKAKLIVPFFAKYA